MWKRSSCTRGQMLLRRNILNCWKRTLWICSALSECWRFHPWPPVACNEWPFSDCTVCWHCTHGFHQPVLSTHGHLLSILTFSGTTDIKADGLLPTSQELNCLLLIYFAPCVTNLSPLPRTTEKRSQNRRRRIQRSSNCKGELPQLASEVSSHIRDTRTKRRRGQ